MKDRKRRPSSMDVAKLAGVSRTTVSFVINDAPGQTIPPATRERVLAAAAALGYSPSPEARLLRSGRGEIVLCLLPDWPVAGPIGVFLEALNEALSEAGLTMLSHQRSPRGTDVSRVLASLTPAAVIATCELTSAEVAETSKLHVPLLRWAADIPGLPDETHLAQDSIGRAQGETLIADGHTRLAYVEPMDARLRWFSEPRLRGLQDACRTAGLPPPLVARPEGETSWLSELHRQGVTALACYNDDVAFAAINLARRSKINVPTDLAVMGVDNSAIASASDPTITTIEFDLVTEAQLLAQRVAGLVGGHEQPRREIDGLLTVVRRASTAWVGEPPNGRLAVTGHG